MRSFTFPPMHAARSALFAACWPSPLVAEQHDTLDQLSGCWPDTEARFQISTEGVSVCVCVRECCEVTFGASAGLLPLYTDCVAKGTVARTAVTALSPPSFLRLCLFSLLSHVSVYCNPDTR